MKKQYTTPEVEIQKVHTSEIICTSVNFGDGETTVMHSKQWEGLADDDNLWDE